MEKDNNNEPIGQDTPLVSVLIPVYNGENYIKDAIISVLKQTYDNFELLIVNDGSTDNSVNKALEYKTDKVTIYSKAHNGISEALNVGIRRCKGKYIARLDADDLMYLNRLEIQVDYMEKHPECDILSTGCDILMSDGNGKRFNPTPGVITKTELINSNNLVHSTIMFRKDSLIKLPCIYESMYDGCEDYKLYLNAVSHGLTIHSISTPTTIYRNDRNQLQSALNNNKLKIDRIKRAYTNINKGELTCIITFCNEGVEIEKTVNSIRATANNVNILLINDSSTDNYDYESIAKLYDCKYITTPTNLGVAEARNFAINNCDTEYFVILDGHMRFYDDAWDDKLLAYLKKHKKSIICSCSSIISTSEEGEYFNEKGTENTSLGKGAVVEFTKPNQLFAAKQVLTSFTKKELIKIPCILGAVYASNKTWWNYIGGLKGLVSYGGDESLLSIKTFLAGGYCYLINDWAVGHVYRTNYPYNKPKIKELFNILYLIKLFAPNNKVKQLVKTYKNCIGDNNFDEISKLFNQNIKEFNKIKKHLTSISVKSFNDFIKFNAEYIYKLYLNI